MVFDNPAPKKDNSSNIVGELSRRVNDNTRRIRIIEDELENLDSRVNSMEQTVMDSTKELNSMVKNVVDDQKSLSDRQANTSVDIQKINGQLKNLVTRQELREIKEYIGLMRSIVSSSSLKKHLPDR